MFTKRKYPTTRKFLRQLIAETDNITRRFEFCGFNLALDKASPLELKSPYGTATDNHLGMGPCWYCIFRTFLENCLIIKDFGTIPAKAMDVLQYSCRNQFTSADFSFVQQVLSNTPQQCSSLESLLRSEEERDAILDDDALYRAVIDHTSCLNISSAFYFYILTRKALRRVNLDERNVSDYVACVLYRSCRTDAVTRPVGESASGSRQLIYLSDLLLRIQHASPHEAFRLRTHLANCALLLSGIFFERLQVQCQRRGAPGLSYYEAMGQNSFLAASRDPACQSLPWLQRIFEVLAEEFHRIRLALNDLAVSVLHFHPETVPAF